MPLNADIDVFEGAVFFAFHEALEIVELGEEADDLANRGFFAALFSASKRARNLSP
jgi:hypothetical protein